MDIINMRQQYHLPEQYERDADMDDSEHDPEENPYPEDEEDLIEEVQGGHCTAACQHASKIECVCGCKGRNHGIKAISRLDMYLPA